MPGLAGHWHVSYYASLQAQNFPAHKPRDLRIPSAQAMTHVAWSCDGKRLAAVGVDKATRLWAPETSVSLRMLHYVCSLTRRPQMEYRAAIHFSGGHSDDVDHVSWNPTHPELFCTSSQRDRRVVFWDARRKGIERISILTLTICFKKVATCNRSN